MSVEHGGHHEDNTITGLITSLILGFLGIGSILGVVEETMQSVVNPQAGRTLVKKLYIRSKWFSGPLSLKLQRVNRTFSCLRRPKPATVTKA